MVADTVDPALVRAIEDLVRPGEQPDDVSPCVFGRWAAGKPFDLPFLADRVSAVGERVTVSFNDGEVVLTIVEPGRWWTADGEVTVADAKSVHLHIHLSWGPRPDDGDLDCRILDFRTEPGAVTDREGHRVRWYPPGRARRLRHLGARRVPAVRLVRLPESLRGRRRSSAARMGLDGRRDGRTRTAIVTWSRRCRR